MPPISHRLFSSNCEFTEDIIRGPASFHHFVWFIWRGTHHKYMSSAEWMTNSSSERNVGLLRQTSLRCKCALDLIACVPLCAVGAQYVQSWYGAAMLFIIQLRFHKRTNQKTKTATMSTIWQNVSRWRSPAWTGIQPVQVFTHGGVGVVVGCFLLSSLPAVRNSGRVNLEAH